MVMYEALVQFYYHTVNYYAVKLQDFTVDKSTLHFYIL